MRITNNMIINNIMRNLNNNLKRMNDVNQQLSTGKKFKLPSDDPIGVSKSLKLNTDLSKIEQYKRNADDALSWMEVTESAVAEIGEVLQRARELAVDAANGTKTPDDLKKISSEIGQLKDHIIKVANTTYAGRYIFSGYKTDQELLVDDGKYNFDLKQGEVSVYNVGVAENIEVNTVGLKIFGTGDSDYSSDASENDKSYLIDVFDKFEDALNNDDSTVIQESIDKIDGCMNQLLQVRADIGAKTNRLELTKSKLESQTLTFTELLSNNEDVDMAEAIMNLNVEQNIYRASLAAGAQSIQPSLIDFLR